MAQVGGASGPLPTSEGRFPFSAPRRCMLVEITKTAEAFLREEERNRGMRRRRSSANFLFRVAILMMSCAVASVPFKLLDDGI